MYINLTLILIVRLFIFKGHIPVCLFVIIIKMKETCGVGDRCK